jgi:hypothetical protein
MTAEARRLLDEPSSDRTPPQNDGRGLVSCSENTRLTIALPSREADRAPRPPACGRLYRRQASDTLLLYRGTLRRRLHLLDRDSHPQGFQPSDQSLPLRLDVHAIEVVTAQFLRALPARQPVLDPHQNTVPDGHTCLLLAQPPHESMVVRAQIRPFAMTGHPRRLHQGGT